MFAAESVQRFHHAERRQSPAVDGDAIALFESERDIFRFVGGVFGRDGQLEHVLVRWREGVHPGIFEDARLEGNVQKVPIHRVWLLGTGLHGNPFLSAVLDHLLPAWKGLAEPFIAPGRDNLQLRRERGGGEFKTRLVVALAGGTVRDGVGLLGLGDLDHPFGDEGTGDAGAEEILAFVNRSGAHDREDKVAGEFLLQVIDVNFRRAGFPGLPVETVEFLLLADVGTEGDHLRAVLFLDPREQNRGVESARIGQNNFHTR